jgi:hypothetical protein
MKKLVSFFEMFLKLLMTEAIRFVLKMLLTNAKWRQRYEKYLGLEKIFDKKKNPGTQYRGISPYENRITRQK